jgi:hypothetical protein
MAPYTRSQVPPSVRSKIEKNVEMLNKKVYEEQQCKKMEYKENLEMKRAAEILLSLSKVPKAKPEPVNHRPVTRSITKSDDQIIRECFPWLMI